MITITLSSSSCGCPAPPSSFVLLSLIFSSPCLSAWRAFNIPICGPTDEKVSPFLSRKSHCFASCFSVIFTGWRSLNQRGFLLLRLCVFTGLLPRTVQQASAVLIFAPHCGLASFSDHFQGFLGHWIWTSGLWLILYHFLHISYMIM